MSGTAGMPDADFGRIRSTLPDISFRPAGEGDCSDLAILSDAATRGLVSHFWGLAAQTGQSRFEVGREAIRSNTAHFSHHANWHIAEIAGRTAGALNGYVLPPCDDLAPVPGPPLLHPLNELKAVAAGTWYISAASVFPEFRNRGVGEAILAKAERVAAQNGLSRVTLMVGSFNDGAQRLYRRCGFAEWERRRFNPFPGSDPEGDWILMRKDLPAE